MKKEFAFRCHHCRTYNKVAIDVADPATKPPMCQPKWLSVVATTVSLLAMTVPLVIAMILARWRP